MRRWLRPAAVLCLLFGLPNWQGCGDVEIPKSIDEVKQSVAPIVEQAQPTAEPTIFEVDAGAKINLGTCYAVLIPAAGDRPAVLQVTSYKSPSEEAFPSIFLRAVVPSGSAQLAGQSLPAQLWIQQSSSGAVLFSQESQPVTVQISKAADKRIEGTIAAGTLQTTDGGQGVSLTGGTFQGSLE